MIKNGRPYTCEGSWEDKKLITDALPERQEQVAKWIDEHISPAKKKNAKYNSYSLKHKFAAWLGANEKMSNNQFKDAMMQKGYMPVDPNEEDWQYKIKVAEESNDLDKLQRKLLPDQNEVLANFVQRNIPSIDVQLKSRATNSHYYMVANVEWYLNVNKNQYVITIWEYNDYKRRKTIRLPRIKGVIWGDKE